MPTWTGNILQTYKLHVYREERVRIRNSEIDCRMWMYDNLTIGYQSIIIVRFERIVSGRFSPLTRSRDLPLPLHRIFQVPLPLIRFSYRAPLHFPLPLRSHALWTESTSCFTSSAPSFFFTLFPFHLRQFIFSYMTTVTVRYFFLFSLQT